MSTKNALRVTKYNKKGGYKTKQEKYRILRDKYGIDSGQANNMKFWSVDRIIDYLAVHNIKPKKSLKEVDRL